MKTKEQILGWLDKQPWKGEFYENVFKLGSADEISYNGCFISHAFPWCATEQGEAAWIMRDTEFSLWYNSNDKPMSWKEYCEQNPIKEDEYFIDSDCTIGQAVAPPRKIDRDADDANVMSKDLCEAFVTYMKLIQLRNAWIKGVEDNRNCKILVIDGEISVPALPLCSEGLSFPTDKMAHEFMDTFKDLLETAKPLL